MFGASETSTPFTTIDPRAKKAYCGLPKCVDVCNHANWNIFWGSYRYQCFDQGGDGAAECRAPLRRVSILRLPLADPNSQNRKLASLREDLRKLDLLAVDGCDFSMILTPSRPYTSAPWEFLDLFGKGFSKCLIFMTPKALLCGVVVP